MADTQHSDQATRTTAGARLAAKRAAKAARKAANRQTDTNPETEGEGAVAGAAGPQGQSPGSSQDTPPEDDQIMQAVGQASSWVDDNQRTLWLGLGGVIVLGLAIVFMGSQSKEAGLEAATSLATGTKAFTAPILTEEELEQVSDKLQPKQSFPTGTARAKEAQGRFAMTAAEQADTPVAPWAQLGEGNAQLELGAYDKAEKLFEALRNSAGDNAYLQLRAWEGTGFSLEGQRAFDKAAVAFEELAKVGDGSYGPLADYHVGRMLAAQGKVEGAIKRYKQLVDKLDGARTQGESGPRFAGIKAEAERRLAELGAPPAKPAGGMGNLPPELLEQLRRQIGGATE